MPELGSSTILYRDYDGEPSTVSVNHDTLTAVNFDAQLAAFVALQDAIAGVTEGLKQNTGFGNYNRVVKAKATSNTAQRESKWLVTGHDVTTLKPWRMEIPCPDRDQLDPNDRKHANIGDGGVVDALVSAIEAFCRSDVGNNVSVEEITYVGRNI